MLLVGFVRKTLDRVAQLLRGSDLFMVKSNSVLCSKRLSVGRQVASSVAHKHNKQALVLFS